MITRNTCLILKGKSCELFQNVLQLMLIDVLFSEFDKQLYLFYQIILSLEIQASDFTE